MIVQSLRYHRNGSFGAGYYAARITWRADGRRYKGTAIVFDASEHVAVNSDDGTGFRCEDFEPQLRAFIESPAGQAMAFPHEGKHKIVEGLREATSFAKGEPTGARVTHYEVTDGAAS